MKIETKFNVGDRVWALADGKHFEAQITEILIGVRCGLPHIRYRLGHVYIRTENAVFPSKSALLESL